MAERYIRGQVVLKPPLQKPWHLSGHRGASGSRGFFYPTGVRQRIELFIRGWRPFVPCQGDSSDWSLPMWSKPGPLLRDFHRCMSLDLDFDEELWRAKGGEPT